MPKIESMMSRFADSLTPILFLDTCIFLDIVRSTMLCLEGYTEAASRLLKMVSDPSPTCLIVISSAVPDEWARNIDDVTKSVSKHLAQIERQSLHFHEACRALGIGLALNRGGYDAYGLELTLRSLSEQLLDASGRLDHDDRIPSRAFRRVVNKIPPASAKREWQDCYIIEDYLETCRTLRLMGHGSKLVFCTSNKNDYCLNADLHPELANEFDEFGLNFKPNLPGALHALTH